MDIILEKLGRRYNSNWVFSDFSYSFTFPGTFAVLGPNGSGKSTLIKIISGYLSPTEGRVRYFERGKEISIEKIYQKISLSAPYSEIPVWFRVLEFLNFHFGMKGLYPGLNLEKLLEGADLKNQKQKYIRDLSTGLQQRVKLIAALGSNTSVVLLDEPTANLDRVGQDWFRSIFQEQCSNRTILMGSNISSEFELCSSSLNISDFKTR